MDGAEGQAEHRPQQGQRGVGGRRHGGQGQLLRVFVFHVVPPMFCLENGPAGPNERLAALGQVGSLSPESIPHIVENGKREMPRDP